MPKILLLSALFCLAFFSVKAQQPYLKKDSTLSKSPQIDTIKPAYVNKGKIAGRKAVFRALVAPGWGQLGNGVTVYRLVKVGALYTGATLLTLSYMSNNKQYQRYLKELQYRFDHNDQPNPDSDIPKNVSTSQLTIAKDTYRRNKEVIIFSFVALYAVQAIEAYVDARLMYFDVGDDLAIRFSPTLINNGAVYGYNPYTPGLKVSFRF
ncbi:DUF5683 domain-containing protein [Pedobacter sp.]|jgi:hypothetical protein|uniref:DUF5683 domain-containing protein n=1 Tax=Pedobacter sp. TaxID=1411316 RepID=UPI002C4946B5|nr:DUF5683 domain-containing protein [Pedobacter sp.]HWW37990.1 DUF5683 domain-containing protein [Pedobacter sp.]